MKLLSFKRIFFIIVLVLLLIQVLVIGLAKVDGSSMKPNLKNNQYLLYSKINRNFKRFDIIVIKVENKLYVKRIIGLPGENIKYIDNELYVNDLKTLENFEKGVTENFELSDIYSSGKIPNNQYLVLGDNREYSYDSRNFGLVAMSDIKGKVLFGLF